MQIWWRTDKWSIDGSVDGRKFETNLSRSWSLALIDMDIWCDQDGMADMSIES
jgi:hypothetical protein